ncbi:tetratricopeptide repeat protein [Nakamurella lactea]|uniref:tetratricopeptide repeat protein n=1 Tax=Nakamurella lactea TaxID=459515 RepID=UPI001B7F9273|nr:tetratricopeptide repeat protein [Nakamurella lactea]
MSDVSQSPRAVAIRGALAAHGSMSEGELATVLAADGIDLGPHPTDTLNDILDLDPELILPLLDKRWAWLPGLLDGRILTHRLTAVEREYDLLVLDPDLSPLTILTESPNYQHLSDGSPLANVSGQLDAEALAACGVPEDAVGGEGALLFEPGRFAGLGVRIGDLVGLRVTADGFDLVAVDAIAPSEVGLSIPALLDQVSDGVELLDLAIWTACAGAGTLFSEPAAPLGELLVAGGLAVDGGWVAREGFDFDSWRVRHRIEAIGEHYDLDDDEALAVLATLRLCERTAELVDAVTAAQESGEALDLAELLAQPPDPADRAPETDDESDADRATMRATLEFLAEPVVVAAVLDEINDSGQLTGAVLGLFAESVEPAAPRAARPALRWLRANAYEQLGNIADAERTYHEAESLDPTWPLTLLSLARYASDRGDAERWVGVAAPGRGTTG